MLSKIPISSLQDGVSISPTRSGTGQKLVLDQTDDDLHDCTSDTATNELASQGGNIDTRRSVACCSAKQGSKQLAAADAAKCTGYQIAHISEISVFDQLAASCSAGRATNEFCENSFHKKVLLDLG
jgi:hypothetical protein